MCIKNLSDYFKTLACYFEQNEYLDKYITLLSGYTTNTEGEKHHAIPVCFYKQLHKCNSRKAAEKFANADSNNLIIQLPIQQHVLAHFYLCKCCKDRLLFERLFNAFKFLFNKQEDFNINTLDETDVIAQIELSAQERQKDCFGKPVLCVETNTVYPNVSAANEAMGKDRYKYLGIYHTCANRGGQQSALGYHWCFYNDGQIPEQLKGYLGSNEYLEYKTTGTKIYCVETGQTFKSAYEAGKYFGVTRGRILYCCSRSWLTVNDLHICYEADKDTFVIKEKPGMSDEARKNISLGTVQAMASIPESRKQEMREKNKKFWAENKLHYYNNGVEEARLPSCPDGWTNGRLEKYKTKGKPVKCVELNTTYCNCREAGRLLGINGRGINNCVRGKAKSAGGYHWQYA